MKSLCRIFVLIVAVCGINFNAHAQVQGADSAAKPATNSTTERYHVDYVVRADATNDETNDFLIRINNRAGVDARSQVRIAYSEKSEVLTLLEAYVVTADGQRKDVPADKIHSQESYSSANATMYADQKVKVIVFPELTPGAKIGYRYRLTRNVPFFPGYFGFREVFSPYVSYLDAKVTLTAPASVAMKIFTRDMQGSDLPSIKNGLARWEWRYQRQQPMPQQNWAASAADFAPLVMASTYQSLGEMGAGYRIGSGNAAFPTAAIRALADKLTIGVVDRRRQAQLLYEWVAKNIRYVAVYIGNGTVKPNPAEQVMNNLYGDCKDHVVLLEALLAAKNIDSTAVLIGAGLGPRVPEVAVLQRFNHAITYIPEFDLYLDSTSQYARFGQLPEGDLAAPVIHAKTGVVSRTPVPDAQRTGEVSVSRFIFRPNGDVSGSTVVEQADSFEMGIREFGAGLNAQNTAQMEQMLLTSAGMTGKGHLDLNGDPADFSKNYGFKFNFEAVDYVDFTQPGGMPLPLMPGIGNGMRNFHRNVATETNETPFYCKAEFSEEKYVIELPRNVRILAIPKDLAFTNQAGDYSMTWRRDGQKVEIVHRLQQNAVRGEQDICRAEDYKSFRDLYQQVRRGFRAQLLYGDVSSAAK